MSDPVKPLRVRLLKSGLVVGFKTDHPQFPLRGTVRPATVTELREQAAAEAACRDAAARTKCEAEFYARHIKTWEVVDEADQPLPVTAESIASLPPEVYHQLFSVVSGACGDALVGKSG